jgi:hypothetical protein
MLRILFERQRTPPEIISLGLDLYWYELSPCDVEDGHLEEARIEKI